MPDRLARVWSGTQWELINGLVTFPSAVVYYQGTAPTGVPTGTLWVNSSTLAQSIYNGSGWTTVSNPSGVATLTGTETLTNKTLVDAKNQFSINAQAASYTLVLTDRDKIVEISNASPNTLTVPPNSSVAFPIGSTVTVCQTGAGQTTLTPGAGVTINSSTGLKLRAQWATATLIKRGTDAWVAFGDIAA